MDGKQPRLTCTGAQLITVFLPYQVCVFGSTEESVWMCVRYANDPSLVRLFLLFAVIEPDGLDVVAILVEDECRVVADPVVGAVAGRAVVLRSRGERFFVKVVYRSFVFRFERDVTGFYALFPGYPKTRLPAFHVSARFPFGMVLREFVADGLERLPIKFFRCVVVPDGDACVRDHTFFNELLYAT